MSADGLLPPGTTERHIAEAFGDPPLEKCDGCGLAFAPLYDGDTTCHECRTIQANNDSAD